MDRRGEGKQPYAPNVTLAQNAVDSRVLENADVHGTEKGESPDDEKYGNAENAPGHGLTDKHTKSVQ